MTSNATAGDETRINTFTTGAQGYSSVIGLADGGTQCEQGQNEDYLEQVV